MNIRVFFYDGVDYSTGEMLSASVAFSENYIDFIGYELLPSDKCSIIMRGTGLKDKNGLEIYEGDILIKGNGHKHIVKYNKGCFCLNVNVHLVEIIGNIYENPELLERSVKADA